MLVALVFLGIWLSVMTLVLVLVVRQIGVLTIRLSLAGETFSVENDGPEIGSKLTTEAMMLLPENSTKAVCFMLISSTCAPCRSLAVELRGQHFDTPVIALVAGSAQLADGLVQLLPSGIQVVRDPDASRIAQSLEIQSTPFAVMVEAGKVKRKSYLYSIDSLLRLIHDQPNLQGSNVSPL